MWIRRPTWLLDLIMQRTPLRKETKTFDICRISKTNVQLLSTLQNKKTPIKLYFLIVLHLFFFKETNIFVLINICSVLLFI